MKLSEYAKMHGVTYRTAWNRFKAGKIKGAVQIETGTIEVPENVEEKPSYGVILYARTSSSQNKKLIENQIERLKDYAAAKGYKVKKIVKEFGSGLNDERKQLTKILTEDKFDKIIVENKDRLIRFNFDLLGDLFKYYGTKILVLNDTLDNKSYEQELTEDLISIIHYFSMKSYSHRRKLNKIRKELEEKENP